MPTATSTPLDRGQRKRSGAYYSPPSLVEPMVGWAIARADQAVLDPSCGDGVFLQAAARRLGALGATAERTAALLHAVELNPAAAAVTQERLAAELGVPLSNLHVASFFSLAPPGALFANLPGVDVVIGNPPYIRYQEFAGGARREALERIGRTGVQLTRLASAWAHFVVHALSFLRPGGRLAMILPAELIHASYAAPLREHLRRSFEMVHVISFRQAVFPEVQEEVVLLLASGKDGGPARLALSEVEGAEEVAGLAGVPPSAEVFAPGAEPEKWIPGHADHPGAVTLRRLEEQGLVVPLAEVGKANIGFVSGANHYFVLTPEEADHWRLPRRSLRPALIRARQLPGLQLTAADLARVRSRGERCMLWLPAERLTRAERAYVKRGEELGFSGRYKCRARSPWFRVPGVVTPDAFLTYMSDVAPRLCLNRARTAASNTLLTLRLPRVPAALRKAFVVAFYNSATLLSCERIGRSYGGGVLKLEPSEADRILVPSPSTIARHQRALARLAVTVDAVLRNGMQAALHEVTGAVDAVLFGENDCAHREMAEARAFLNSRRQARARSVRDRKPRAGLTSENLGS